MEREPVWVPDSCATIKNISSACYWMHAKALIFKRIEIVCMIEFKLIETEQAITKENDYINIWLKFKAELIGTIGRERDYKG